MGLFVCFEKSAFGKLFQSSEAAAGCNPAEGWLMAVVSCICQSAQEDAPAQGQAMSTLSLLEKSWHLFLATKLPPTHPCEAQSEERSKATCNRCRTLPNSPSSHSLLKVPLVILSLPAGVQGGFHPAPFLPVPALPHLRNCFCQRNPSDLCWGGLWSSEELTGASADPWLWTSSSHGIAAQPA